MPVRNFSFSGLQQGRDFYPSPASAIKSPMPNQCSFGFSGNNPLPSVSGSNTLHWPNRGDFSGESFTSGGNKESVGKRKDVPNNGYRLFGIQLVNNYSIEEPLPTPVISASAVEDQLAPTVETEAESEHELQPSSSKSDVPAISSEPDKSSLRSPQESQSKHTRSCTKVVVHINMWLLMRILVLLIFADLLD